MPIYRPGIGWEYDAEDPAAPQPIELPPYQLDPDVNARYEQAFARVATEKERKAQ